MKYKHNQAQKLDIISIILRLEQALPAFKAKMTIVGRRQISQFWQQVCKRVVVQFKFMQSNPSSLRIA